MVVFAHRGASGYRPQNSIKAAQTAIEMGAQGIEFDVQLSKDGIPVIIHDFFLNKLTVDGKGYVKDYTLEELRQLTLLPKNGYSHEKIPTLHEFMEVLSDDMLINVELKSLLSDNQGIEDVTVEVLRKFPNKKNILISSFDHELLSRFHKKYPEYMIGALTGTNIINMGKYFSDIPIKLESVNLALELVEENLVKELHDAGYKVYVYTVNDKETALKFMEMGIDGIFSDFPDIMEF